MKPYCESDNLVIELGYWMQLIFDRLIWQKLNFHNCFRTKIQGISKNSSIRDLVSGKLPNQLIQAVFQLVKENSRLNKVVGPKLDMKIVDNLELNSIVRTPSRCQYSYDLFL